MSRKTKAKRRRKAGRAGAESVAGQRLERVAEQRGPLEQQDTSSGQGSDEDQMSASLSGVRVKWSSDPALRRAQEQLIDERDREQQRDRQQRYRERQREQGRKPRTFWLTDEERAAVAAYIDHMRGDDHGAD